MTPLKDQGKDELIAEMVSNYISSSSYAAFDILIRKVYDVGYNAGRKAGLREAMGVVPEKKEYPFYNGRTNPDTGTSGFNHCRTETLQAIEKLYE